MDAIKNYSLDDLKKLVLNLGYESYRADQIYTSVFKNRLREWSKITTLPKTLKDELSKEFYIDTITNYEVQNSKDGTKKFLFELRNGDKIESVYIPSNNGTNERRTLCVSSQVGCALGCEFCATGKLGLTRNLSVGEIVDQIFFAEQIIGERLSNVVFMGMGEPLQNFKNLVKALEILTDDRLQLFSRKNITVSTSGVVPKIFELARIRKPVKLAISLHSTFDSIRSKLMPIALRWNLSELRDAACEYYRITKIPITYEYIMFDNLNDREVDAKRLAKLTRAVPSKVNLIPFHPIDFLPLSGFARELKPTPIEKILKFMGYLRNLGVKVFLRESSGVDIDAACGQLAFSKRQVQVHK